VTDWDVLHERSFPDLVRPRNNTAYLGGAFNLEDESYIHLRETTVLGNNCTGKEAVPSLLPSCV
jgi:hypothetical protein